MKKLVILTIVILIIALAVGLYLYFKKSPQGPAGEPSVPGVISGDSIDKADSTTSLSRDSALPMPVKISAEPVSYFWLDAMSNLFYINENSQIMGVSSGGDESVISNLPFDKIFSVESSPDKKLVLIGFFDGDKPAFRLFNNTARSWRSLPAGTVGASWSPDGSRIAYLVRDGRLHLYILEMASAEARRILDLSMADVQLTWPETDIIYLFSRPSRLVESGIVAVNLQTGTSAEILTGRGLTLGSTAGSASLVFSNKNGLWAVNGIGESLAAWPGLVSFPHKCAVDINKIFCGVSSNLTLNDFPDKYLKRVVYSFDFLALGLFDKNNLAPLPIDTSLVGPLDVWAPIFNDGRVVFINRYDNFVYSLDLPSP